MLFIDKEKMLVNLAGYGRRDLRDIDTIVFHTCAKASQLMTFNVPVNQPYGFLKVEQLLPIKATTEHVGNKKDRSCIAVHLEGDLTAAPPPKYQVEACSLLIGTLQMYLRRLLCVTTHDRIVNVDFTCVGPKFVQSLKLLKTQAQGWGVLR